MLGDSGEVLESFPVAATAGEEEKLEDSGEIATVSGGGGGGNRWPRPETLALLRIRSEMDSAFRDSALKSPLWEQISRNMAELGYRRSAKKCKEKFENVYKYHKRTKEGRFSKPEGKSYRFYNELEAFESLHSYPLEPKSRIHKLPPTTTVTTTASLVPWINPSNGTNPTLFTKKQSTIASYNSHTVLSSGYKTNPNDFPSNVPWMNLFSSSTSSSTASDEEEIEGKRSRKRRKYFKGLLKRLTNDLMEKQDKMQKKFLETLEKLEKERVAREEAWRIQETARIHREYEILVHGRSEAAVKDSAIISFLQNVSGQQIQQFRGDQKIRIQNDQKQDEIRTVEATSKKMNNGDNSNYFLSPSSSRWPKAEVEALIRLRTNADDYKFQENGAKGSLWEEISVGMRRLGYNRNAKRCKEKWENINKYFKKVKENNKKRPIDSKTCPYFHQLEAIYKEKNKASALSLMAAPQQQLLPPQESYEMENLGNGNRDEERDSEEEENETGGFEMAMNKTVSPMDIDNNVFA
ncbi:PREDICTED: trihelix transcription factor GT-2-like [Tarenaya hassleriana]|uniref:trihelix transcription factor GT-2-like n=1 Tax=Tarenaya hassleriana TaxID=28532 RepID=UPI00053C1553|nr:PREDICTED: trihelix transcription factor GT-2-like [Tarenaya hassleriana]